MSAIIITTAFLVPSLPLRQASGQEACPCYASSGAISICKRNKQEGGDNFRLFANQYRTLCFIEEGGTAGNMIYSGTGFYASLDNPSEGHPPNCRIDYLNKTGDLESQNIMKPITQVQAQACQKIMFSISGELGM